MLTRSLKKDDLRLLLVAISKAIPGTNPIKKIDLTPSALDNATQWAKASCLLDEQGLTPEGELMALKDPYLEATVTDWVMHINLGLGDNRSLWSYIVCEFLSVHSQFTLDNLLEDCHSIFTKQTSEQLKKNIKLILKTYTEKSGILNINFLEKTKSVYSIGNPQCSNVYTIGYLLAKIWEDSFGSRDAVLVTDLLTLKPSLATILGVQESEIRVQLDTLAEHQIIEQRSTKPHELGTRASLKSESELDYQVVRLWKNPVELLERAYENDRSTPNQPLIKSLEGILDDTDDMLDFSHLLDWTFGFILIQGGKYSITEIAA